MTTPAGYVRPASGRAKQRSRAGLILAAAVLAACEAPSSTGSAATPTASPATPALTVFAAASLRNALSAVSVAYLAATGTRIVSTTDSSTALRTQLEQGAQADVFLSADTRNPDALAASGLTDGEVVRFAGNRLAIVVPADNPAHVVDPFDLARPGLKVIAAGEAVPISAYATRLVDNLAALTGAPVGLPAAYAANIVSREDNVQAVLTKIELGEGDVAIVYASDVAASSALRSIDIPPTANVVATYAGAVPRSAEEPAAGHAFLDWLAGPAGRAILGQFGFSEPP